MRDGITVRDGIAVRGGTETGRGESPLAAGGVAARLLTMLGRGGKARPRLRLLERISLAPRQSLALVEAEGRRLLVATSADGAPCFYPLDERSAEPSRRRPVPQPARAAGGHGRVSW